MMMCIMVGIRFISLCFISLLKTSDGSMTLPHFLRPARQIFVASVTRFFLTSTPRFCYFPFVFILESSLQVNPLLNDFCEQMATGYTTLRR